MGNLTSSFTIAFLSGTDSLYVEENVVKFEDDNSSAESAGSLLQVYNADDGTIAPDWTVTTNQPCLKLALTKSSDGENINLTGATFQYQGNDVEFDETSYTSLNGMIWYTSTGDYEGMFMKTYSDDDTNYAYFRICANIASSEITTNQQIAYTLSYSDSTFGSGSMTSTTDILIREGSSSSIYCNITTDNTELSTSVTSTTLSVQYFYGSTEFTSLEALMAEASNVASLAWYRDGDLTTKISTDGTLTVYRSEEDDSDGDNLTGNYVDGCNVFNVAVLDASGNVLASDSQRITDVADQYQVKLTSTGTVRSNKSVTVKGVLYDGDEPYEGSVTYTTSVNNSVGEQTGAEETTTSSDGDGFSRTISADECKYTDSSDEEDYGECYLVVTCSF